MERRELLRLGFGAALVMTIGKYLGPIEEAEAASKKTAFFFGIPSGGGLSGARVLVASTGKSFAVTLAGGPPDAVRRFRAAGRLRGNKVRMKLLEITTDPAGVEVGALTLTVADKSIRGRFDVDDVVGTFRTTHRKPNKRLMQRAAGRFEVDLRDPETAEITHTGKMTLRANGTFVISEIETPPPGIAGNGGDKLEGRYQITNINGAANAFMLIFADCLGASVAFGSNVGDNFDPDDATFDFCRGFLAAGLGI